MDQTGVLGIGSKPMWCDSKMVEISAMDLLGEIEIAF